MTDFLKAKEKSFNSGIVLGVGGRNCNSGTQRQANGNKLLFLSAGRKGTDNTPVQTKKNVYTPSLLPSMNFLCFVVILEV